MVYNGVWTASFLHIIKVFNIDLGSEELFYIYIILHKCTVAIDLCSDIPGTFKTLPSMFTGERMVRLFEVYDVIQHEL